MPDSLLGPKRDKALDVVPVSQEMPVKNKNKQQRKSSVPKKTVLTILLQGIKQLSFKAPEN